MNLKGGADISFDLLIAHIENYKAKNISLGFHQDKDFDKNKLLDLLHKQNSKLYYLQFLIDGCMTKELAEYSIFLAKVDLYFRTGIIDKNFDNHDSNDVQDILTMYYLICDSTFVANEKCYLNPTFGKASMLVGGADADLIIDSTLIDIKVTEHLKLNRDYLNHILG